ncbi:hypothetical protein VTN31DRAFT_3631 [Thermomyces dupontii]|uniref:uncharacterized protein n=1 Tax=Talaromyces thermophilus TaxID=28565 RepID=UPI0037445580
MSSSFASRRKARKVGGDDEDDSSGQDNEPVVKRPAAKNKHKSKLRLSFGPGETSMTDDASETTVITPKRPGLGRRVLEKNASERLAQTTGSREHLPFRVGPDQDRPSYGEEYLKELRDSTPSTPKQTDVSASDEDRKDIDVAAKFGEVVQVSSQPTAIPSEAEIREKKARRARLAREQEYISLNGDQEEEDYLSLDPRQKERDTRLVPDDEDFAEGFDEYVEDGRIALGRKAEREQQRRQREEMRELIEEAEEAEEDDMSDAERHAAYEAAQTRAAMDGMGRNRDEPARPRTPPRVTPLPNLSTCLGRLQSSLAEMETSRKMLVDRMEELRKEKAEIAARETEIQALIKEAGEQYEKLRAEAGLAPGSDALPGDTSISATDRGLESLGTPMAVSRAESDAD